MRPILRTACLVLFAVIVAPRGASASATDTTATDTLSIRTADDSVRTPMLAESLPGQGPIPITVITTDRMVAQYSRVESWPGGFVRAMRGSGEEVFLPAAKIYMILDPDGTDVTKEVLDGRKAVSGGLRDVGGPRVPSSPAFRGRPSPEQRGFTLLQAGLLRQLGPIRAEQDRTVLVADAGRMWNVDASHSLGGSLMLAANNEFTRVGLKPRYRRWLSRTISVDLAPGVFFSVPGDGNPEHAPIGFIGESSLTFGDWFAITGAVHVVGTTRYTYHYQEPTPSPPVPPTRTVESGTKAAAFLGVKAGGEAAIVGSVAAVALIGLMMLTYGGS